MAAAESQAAAAPDVGTWQGLRRSLRRRLIAPLRRGNHSPEHAARSVAAGIAVALTPTTGLQMPLVLFVWIALRRLAPGWTFSLPVALAWTWVTNVATIPPLYFLYVFTGRVLLGRWDRIRGYDIFHGRLLQALPSDASWYEWLAQIVNGSIATFALPLLVGCVPWVVLGTWLGYRWSLRAARFWERRRVARRSRRRVRSASRGTGGDGARGAR